MMHVQAILFASLAVSLLSAFLAMLGKQWLNRYASADMRGSAVEHGRNRQRKLDGTVAWYFDNVLESLPLMLQAALTLLGCALSRYLWDISGVVASVIIGVTSFALIFYLFVVAAGAVSADCPYQPPGSHILRQHGPKVWRIVRLAPSLAISVGSAFGEAFTQSRITTSVVNTVETYYPWWSRREITPFLCNLVLKVPLALVVDVYRLGWAATRVLFALPVGTYHLVRRLYTALKQTAPSDFRCISWTLQTSLDKSVNTSRQRQTSQAWTRPL